MQEIQAKFDWATQAYQSALQDLAAARQAHQEGPGKVYADTCALQADLKAKIAAHEAGAAEAEGTFKRLFAKTNHVVTKEVKAALFGKNDALAIAEELRNALAQSEAGAIESKIAASKAASSYQAAYRNAWAAYARVEVYRTLLECGEAMSRAVAVATHIPEQQAREMLSDDVNGLRSAFVWNTLMDMARDTPEWSKLPPNEEIGALDLGPFNDSSHFVSPAAAHRQVKQLRAGDHGAGRIGAREAAV